MDRAFSGRGWRFPILPGPIISLQDDSSIKYTVAEWLTPNNRAIDKVGIEPDHRVEFNENRDEVLLKALGLFR